MRPLPVRQVGLWEVTCHTCYVFDQCGGMESAPCGCVHTGERYRDCEHCAISCTERLRLDGAQVVDSFWHRLREGLPLSVLRLQQPSLDLPSFLLSRTESLPLGFGLTEAWVGVHLRVILRFVRAEPAWAEPASSIRSHLRVGPTTRLIGILSGDDDLLECLWQLDRAQVLDRLRSARIEILTGPTYSVYGEDPASHRVMMLLRHHRFCADAARRGFTVIPNIYWNSPTHREWWATWLRENPSVCYVARDFSRTKQWAPFRSELDGLLEILAAVERCVGVLVTGVGEKKMEETRRALLELGCYASFVSPEAVVAPPAPGRVSLSKEARAAVIHDRIERFRARAAGMAVTPPSTCPREGSRRSLRSRLTDTDIVALGAALKSPAA